MTKLLLERLTHSDDLEILEAKLNTFNPFRVLKVNEYEIRHSNFLSWILDPHENHNLGERILKKIIVEALLENYEKQLYPIHSIKEQHFSDAIVLREWNHIDVLVISPRNKIALLIENKVYAGESEGQLLRYIEAVKREYRGFTIIPIFLTLDGEEPSEKKFLILSYESILKILNSSLALYQEILNQKVADFIRHYVKILEVLTMQDLEMRELCKKIYQQHKEAFDLISTYNSGSFSQIAEEFKKQNPGVQEIRVKNTQFWFIPKEWARFMPNFSKDWISPYPVSLWFDRRSDDKLGLIVEVGPFTDAQKRIDFLHFLQQNDKDKIFRIGKDSLSPLSKYTRIWSEFIPIKNWDDTSVVAQEMSMLYQKSAKSREEVYEIIKSYRW